MGLGFNPFDHLGDDDEQFDPRRRNMPGPESYGYGSLEEMGEAAVESLKEGQEFLQEIGKQFQENTPTHEVTRSLIASCTILTTTLLEHIESAAKSGYDPSVLNPLVLAMVVQNYEVQLKSLKMLEQLKSL